jgi:hypothetical protein
VTLVRSALGLPGGYDGVVHVCNVSVCNCGARFSTRIESENVIEDKGMYIHVVKELHRSCYSKSESKNANQCIRHMLCKTKERRNDVTDIQDKQQQALPNYHNCPPVPKQLARSKSRA